RCTAASSSPGRPWCRPPREGSVQSHSPGYRPAASRVPRRWPSVAQPTVTPSAGRIGRLGWETVRRRCVVIYVLALIGAVTLAVLAWRAFGPDPAPGARGYGPDDDPEFLRSLRPSPP